MWTLIRLEEPSDLGPHCLQRLLKSQEMTKQLTVVVIGSLRVKGTGYTE